MARWNCGRVEGRAKGREGDRESSVAARVGGWGGVGGDVTGPTSANIDQSSPEAIELTIPLKSRGGTRPGLVFPFRVS